MKIEKLLSTTVTFPKLASLGYLPSYSYYLPRSSTFLIRPVCIEMKGRGVKQNRVELAENKLILGQIYSTLLYYPSHPLNPNGPISISLTCFSSIGEIIQWKSHSCLLQNLPRLYYSRILMCI